MTTGSCHLVYLFQRLEITVRRTTTHW